jgi:hypothetical protein
MWVMHQALSALERVAALLFGLVLLPFIYWWAIAGAFRGGNDCYDCDDQAVLAMGVLGVVSILAALTSVSSVWVVAATGNRTRWVWALFALAVASFSIALQFVLAPLR